MVLFASRRINTPFYLSQFFRRLFIFGALAYYAGYLFHQPFTDQLIYIAIITAVDLAGHYITSRPPTTSHVAEINDEQLTFGNTSFKLHEIKEIRYCQSGRFEHGMRVRLHNDHYQDFEFSDLDILEEFRFYQFLVDNKLPVVMVDDVSGLNRM